MRQVNIYLLSNVIKFIIPNKQEENYSKHLEDLLKQTHADPPTYVIESIGTLQFSTRYLMGWAILPRRRPVPDEMVLTQKKFAEQAAKNKQTEKQEGEENV